MKKIGIITILKTNNYGAELQAFALQYKLNKMGYDAEIIDYLFYKNEKHKKEKVSLPFYNFPLKKRIKEYLIPILERIKSLLYRKESKIRKQGFDNFHKRFTKFSPITYTSFSQLYNNVPEYDVYCVGSDQVWNPGCFTSLNPYFLTFAPNNKRKISYASSFGVSSIPKGAKQKFTMGLSNLDFISVRERTGISMVKELTGKLAINVVDPTMLLSKTEWKEIASTKKVPKEDYILLYVLKKSPYITKIAQIIAEKRGLKIVRICKEAYPQDRKQNKIINVMDAAPDDFIGLFEHASMVLTNSFHGTIFSTIFKKDFYSVISQKKDNNSRITDILNSINLQSQLIHENMPTPNEYPSIDYTQVNISIEKLRNKSIEYLNTAINEKS